MNGKVAVTENEAGTKSANRGIMAAATEPAERQIQTRLQLDAAPQIPNPGQVEIGKDFRLIQSIGGAVRRKTKPSTDRFDTETSRRFQTDIRGGAANWQ